ncbi:MAG TPA: collagenase-like protease, partial [Bacillota bacterium]|nr:collagenase-like protease [Bacillota bacterium]
MKDRQNSSNVIKMKTELLAPAGNLEKAKIALLYGADAVYVGGTSFSLRARASNFTIEMLKELVAFAHERNKRV